MKASIRQDIMSLVSECVASGSTQAKACAEVGINERRLQRWALDPESEDQRMGPKTLPSNKLTEFEKDLIVSVASSKEFCEMSPHQIVPKLTDRGEFIASESSFYRVLKARKMMAHRGRSKPKTQVSRLKQHEALAPKTLFSWVITYLKTIVQGQYFFLYLFLDVFSRKIVGWSVHDCESTIHSSALLTKICLAEGIDRKMLTVHADNGTHEERVGH